jgi:predicted amidohydrolase YtcJ
MANGQLEVPGGVVERDDRGEPTGVLREKAAWSFRERFMLVSDDEFVEAMRAGVKLALSRGVTAVHDKDGWLGAPRLWQRLAEQGNLDIRVWQSVPYETLPALEEIAVRSGVGDDHLRIGYLKVFMDGALGSGTALMLDGSGVEITSAEELADIVRRAARLGWPVGVHAIGDRANRNALDAFEQTADEWRPRGLRHRIEHAQCLAPEDVSRFASIGVAASVQFSHAPSDRDIAERFWPDKLDGCYAWRSLLDSGAVLANGSDAPIEELHPWAGICAGVLRTLDDRPAWRPEQAVTVEEALHATCVTPAWLARDERRRGKLLPGYLADLVVLDRDPVTCRPEELPEVQVVATMVGGRWLHNPPPWD